MHTSVQSSRVTYNTASLQGCSHLRTLRSLVLDGFYTDGGTRAEGLRALLQQTRQLTELRLHFGVDEADGGWELLSEALQGHTAL